MNIFEAARQGKLKKIKELIVAGANINIMDIACRTALNCARENGHFEIVKLLENAGAKQ
jgi:ankyrin repeat protein